MNGRDVDWTAWTSDWRDIDSTSASSSLARRVRSRGRLLRAWAIAEAVLVVVAVAALAAVAVTTASLVDRVAMLALAVVCMAAGAFAWWNWRDVWHPHAESVRAFVEISVLRCRRLRRAIAAGWWLLVVEIACFVPWLALRPQAGRLRGFVLLSVLAAAGMALLVSMRWWVRREERAIAPLEDELRP
jgi:hypothetical protein